MKTQKIKKDPIMKTIKTSLLDLPTPTSISFLWNMGFLLGMTLVLQIVTGLVVSMMYNSDAKEAFTSMVKIMQDINTGWVTRMLHMNGASLFFILLYIHTGRGIYFNSPMNQKKVWLSGVVILLMVMATAFLGYVLPWGQMSFWGATVITGVLSAIPIVGNDLTIWIWGGPSVSSPTLNRFFSLHFLLPMIIAALAMVHLILLHEKGSSNPANTLTSSDKVKFNPLFSLKDSLPMILISISLMVLISNNPNALGDVENYNTANPLNAPLHIQPEWYFLFAYVILRSIPSKLGGVIALAMSILILTVLVTTKSKPTKFHPIKKSKVWTLISVIVILTWIGAKPVEAPYEGIGQIYSILYFIFMLTL
uniref:Cytochrome b n=1 Tax=Paraleius leontonychus TaxID=1807943 RepID=A0A330JEV4_9ACAR|nr:cytochrome b [Paraleius leontonychus]